MADSNGSLQQDHSNSNSHSHTHTLQSLFHALDPVSLLLSQNPDPNYNNNNEPVTLRLTTESYIMERGPRYNAYAQLRESRLRLKHSRQYEIEPTTQDFEFRQTPPKKQVKFQASVVGGNPRKGCSSVLTQSVPDFQSALRKENRKPRPLQTVFEMTPPVKNYSRGNGNGCGSSLRGSKSVGGGEKKGGLIRKSYANVEDLKGLASAVGSAINGDDRGGGGGRSLRGNGRTVLGYRKF